MLYIVIGLLNDDDDDDGYLVNEGRMFVIHILVILYENIALYYSLYIALFYCFVWRREKEKRRRRGERRRIRKRNNLSQQSKPTQREIMALSIVWVEVWLLSLLSWSFTSFSFHSTPRYGCPF